MVKNWEINGTEEIGLGTPTPGAKAPNHQYPQYWLNIHYIGPVSYLSTSEYV